MPVKEIIRFLTFGSIGLFNSFLDIGIFNFLQKLFFKKNISFTWKFIKLNNYTLAHCISFMIGACSSYILNTVFTFSDSLPDRGNTRFFRFVGITLFTGVLTTILLEFLTGQKVLNFREKYIFTLEEKFLIILNKQILKGRIGFLSGKILYSKKYYHLFADRKSVV